MDVLKHYCLKIEALSPIHIGNGNKIGKKEYIHLPQEQLVLIPDIHRLYTDLQKKGLEQAYLNYMLKNNRDSLGSWLRQSGYRKKDYDKWKRYELSAGDAFLDPKTRSKDIFCFVKDPYGMPYVPGSSLKGMIRTALLAWEVRHNPPKYAKLLDDIKANAGQNKKNTLSRETIRLETEAFHTLKRPEIRKENAVCCNLSGLILSDSMPIPIDQLVLSQKIDYTLEQTENPLPILREALRPGTNIYFDLTIDTQICPYSLEDILKALEEFQRLCYNRFYKRFGRGHDEPDLIWLGGGAGFLSKTVLYPILGSDSCRTVNQIFKATLGKNYDIHKHRRDLSLNISPHVCKCTRYNGKLYDMGMGRIELLKEHPYQ